MGAAGSTNGARELRDLHNAITASGISTIHTTLADSTSPMVRIERLAERLIINETLLTKIDSVEPSNKTTLMYAAASAGGGETLAVIKLLQKHTKNRRIFTKCILEKPIQRFDSFTRMQRWQSRCLIIKMWV